MDPGPTTTSDHLPIILKVTSNPLLKGLNTSRYDFRLANWDGFNENRQSKPAANLKAKTVEEAKEEVQKWYSDAEAAPEQHVPRTNYRTEPHP